MASTSAVRNWVEADHGVANGCGCNMRSLRCPDEQYVQVGKIIFLDDEVIFGGPETPGHRCHRAAAAMPAASVRFAPSCCPRTGTKPWRSHSPDRFCHFRYADAAIDIRRRAHFISPAHARLPPLVDELLRGGGERVRQRVPDVAAAIAVEIDTVLVQFRRQELRQTGAPAQDARMSLRVTSPSPRSFSARMNSLRY